MAEYVANVSQVVHNLSKYGENIIKEIVDVCEAVSGKKIPIKILARRPGDPAALVADFALAKKLLNWQPTHDLKATIKSAWHWEQQKRY